MRSRARDYRAVNSVNSDRHDIAWYWRVLAFLSSCLILGGFLILPATFDTDARLRVSKAALGIFSVALLAAGFSLTGLVSFACRNLVFQADCIFLPSLTGSTLGLLTVFYSFTISSRYTWNVAALLVTIGSAVSTLMYAALLIYTHRRIVVVRRDQGDPSEPISLIQQPSLASPGLSYHEPRLFDNHIANMYPTARHSSTQEPRAAPPDEMSEEDLMRQQMLMLLMNKSEPSISTDSAGNSFNRIDFNPIDEPESAPHPPTAVHAHQLPGGDASDPQTSYYGYYAPPGAPSHTSRPSGQDNLNMHMHMQAPLRLQPWDGVWRRAEPPLIQLQAPPQPRGSPQAQQLQHQHHPRSGAQEQQLRQHHMPARSNTRRREERRRQIEQGQ